MMEKVTPSQPWPKDRSANGTSASVGQAERIMWSNSRDWPGWIRRSLRGAEELPIHAQGRIFVVGAGVGEDRFKIVVGHFEICWGGLFAVDNGWNGPMGADAFYGIATAFDARMGEEFNLLGHNVDDLDFLTSKSELTDLSS